MIVPEVGCFYRLATDPILGDYSGEVVEVEKGPRNPGETCEQYRVSWGTGSHDVDWIDTTMFVGSVKVVPAGDAAEEQAA